MVCFNLGEATSATMSPCISPYVHVSPCISLYLPTSPCISLYLPGMADGEATCSTIFEMQMGMVDRGADLSWLSQYPHEREVS